MERQNQATCDTTPLMSQQENSSRDRSSLESTVKTEPSSPAEEGIVLFEEGVSSADEIFGAAEQLQKGISKNIEFHRLSDLLAFV